MGFEIVKIGNVPVALFVPDNLPELPEGRRVDEDEKEEEEG